MLKTLGKLTLTVALLAGPGGVAGADETNPPGRAERGGSNMMMGPSMNHGDTTGRSGDSRAMENCPMMQSGQCPMMQGQGTQGGGMMGGGMSGMMGGSMGGMMGQPRRPNDQWRQPEAPQR
jgi:hypothetical protein